MTEFSHKTGDLIGSSYIKSQTRSLVGLNIENDDKHCFLRSILASLRPLGDSKTGHSTRISKFRQSFDELNAQGLNFSFSFNCSDVYKFEKLKNSSIKIFESSSYRDGIEQKHELIPFEFSENGSNKVIDLLLFKRQYVLSNTKHVFLGKHDSIFIYSCIHIYMYIYI